MSRHAPRWQWALAIALPVLLLVGVFTANQLVKHSDGADGRWARAIPVMQTAARQVIDAANASNAQGIAEARTRLAAECGKAGSYRAGGSEPERRVRAACAAESLPIGE